MENKNSKSVIYILVLLIVVLLIALSYVLYKSYLLNNSVSNNSNIISSKEDSLDNKSIVDNKIDNSNDGKAAFYYFVNNEQAQVFYALLSEGNLYYHLNTGHINYNDENSKKYSVYSNADSIKSDKFTSYNGLTNISKIRIKNYGTSVHPALFAITNDGKLYCASIFVDDDNNNKIQEFKLFIDDLEIDDVLDWKWDETKDDSTITVLLKNGETKDISKNFSLY